MKTKNHSMPYESWNKKSQEFVNEIHFRVGSALIATEILLKYKKQKLKNWADYHEFESIKYICFTFAIMELATLFDGTGVYSIKLHKGRNSKYLPQKLSVRKHFPDLTVKEFDSIYSRISNLFIDNSQLVDKILTTRNEYIAHASKYSYEKREKHIHSLRFPIKRFHNFASELRSITDQSSFGFYDGFPK